MRSEHKPPHQGDINYGNLTYYERGARSSTVRSSAEGIHYTTGDFTLAIASGHVVIEGKTVWHSKGATFVVDFAPTPWWRRGFKVRVLPDQ